MQSVYSLCRAAAPPAVPACDSADPAESFPIDVTILANREYSKELKTPDGVVATLTTGSLTASFTAHGKTITENISGPFKTTGFPDGSGVVQFKGLTLFLIARDQVPQFNLPAVSVIAGNLTLSVDKEGKTSVSQRGHVMVDVCAALS